MPRGVKGTKNKGLDQHEDVVEPKRRKTRSKSVDLDVPVVKQRASPRVKTHENKVKKAVLVGDENNNATVVQPSTSNGDKDSRKVIKKKLVEQMGKAEFEEVGDGVDVNIDTTEYDNESSKEIENVDNSSDDNSSESDSEEESEIDSDGVSERADSDDDASAASTEIHFKSSDDANDPKLLNLVGRLVEDKNENRT